MFANLNHRSKILSKWLSTTYLDKPKVRPYKTQRDKSKQMSNQKELI